MKYTEENMYTQVECAGADDLTAQPVAIHARVFASAYTHCVKHDTLLLSQELSSCIKRSDRHWASTQAFEG